MDGGRRCAARSVGVVDISRTSRSSGRASPGPGVKARVLAARALAAALDDGDALDKAFASIDQSDLAPRDRGFARTMVLAALRHKGRIDALLNTHLHRSLDKSPPFAAALLRIGAAQILVLGTPLHASVGETTQAARSTKGGERVTGLINATLRRIAETGAERFALLDPASDWPDWLMTRWRKAYGGDATKAMVAAIANPAPTDFTRIDGSAGIDGAIELPTGSLRLEALEAPVDALPGFAEGRFFVQEAAASLAVKALGDVTGRTVIDLCAAPGGKTMQLAAGGARVIAVDRNARRLDRLEDNAARLGFDIDIIEADGREYQSDAPVDGVLIDAPCSATGTLRRHPDVAWHRREKDIASLVQVQRALVENAVDMLKPGGTLIYATCSLEPEEGEAMAGYVKEHVPRLAFDPMEPVAGWKLPAAAWQEGVLRTRPDMWPDLGGLDGFFVARFRKA